MAATAYAPLVSLLNTLDQINTHALVSTFFNKNKNTHLSEMVNFFADFVENYSDADSREVEDLVHRIADAAHKAEDIIEVHAADRVCGQRGRSSMRNLQMIIRDMMSMKDEVIKVKEETGKNPSVLPDLLPSSSSSLDESTTMVGFDDYVQKLWDELTGDDVARSIISITGMGGIGKTTLARNLYENSNTLRHFNVRVWVTVLQESSAKKVFLQALSGLQGGSIDMDTTDDRQLSDKLHKALFNRRYLIVLDDVWSVAIWDKINFYFPENNNGSRIVITTRESKLVNYIGSSAIALKFLDEENSWKLFCEKTFSQQGFPPELEDAGKKIVKKCRGLPLEITVIGGLLGKSLRTQEYWEKIAKDKSLILNRENLQTLKTVHNLILTEEVCKRMSNIKKLHIEYDFTKRGGAQPRYHVENLGCFNKLESLEYRCGRAGDSLKNIKFPSSLKELRLDGCKLEWSCMAVIASLPHLQFLYLNENAIAGTEWVLVDETFCNLKHMIINRCGDVTKWIAESSNFPVLEKLSIWNCPKLGEIPSGIGEIPTLQSIYLSDCSESAYISAVEILHEQQRFENMGLRLIIDISKPEFLREKIEKLGLTCQNLKFGRDW